MDDVGRWQEIGVEDRDELGVRIGHLQRLLERGALESAAVLPMGDLHPGVIAPALAQDVGGVVGRIVGDHHLVVAVIQVGAGGQQTIDHLPLVVHGEVDGDEWLHFKAAIAIAVPIGHTQAVQPVSVLLAVSVAVPVAMPILESIAQAIGLGMAIPVAVPIAVAVLAAGREQDQGVGGVVLQPVDEEGQPEQQRQPGDGHGGPHDQGLQRSQAKSDDSSQGEFSVEAALRLGGSRESTQSGQRILNGLDQGTQVGILDKVGLRSRLERLLFPGLLGGDEDHPASGLSALDLTGGIHAGEGRHVLIHQDDVRVERLGHLDGFPAVGGFADHRHFFELEQDAQLPAKAGAVVHDQGPHAAGSAVPFAHWYPLVSDIKTSLRLPLRASDRLCFHFSRPPLFHRRTAASWSRRTVSTALKD